MPVYAHDTIPLDTSSRSVVYLTAAAFTPEAAP